MYGHINLLMPKIILIQVSCTCPKRIKGLRLLILHATFIPLNLLAQIAQIYIINLYNYNIPTRNGAPGTCKTQVCLGTFRALNFLAIFMNAWRSFSA